MVIKAKSLEIMVSFYCNGTTYSILFCNLLITMVTSILFQTWTGILPLNKNLGQDRPWQQPQNYWISRKLSDLLSMLHWLIEGKKTKKCLTSPHFWALGSSSPSLVIFLHFFQWVPWCPPRSSAFPVLYPPHACADHD